MMSASSRAARRKDHRSEAEKLPPPTCRPPADTAENTCHWLQSPTGRVVKWWWHRGRWCWMDQQPNRRAPEGIWPLEMGASEGWRFYQVYGLMPEGIWPLEMGASGWTYVGPAP